MIGPSVLIREEVARRFPEPGREAVLSALEATDLSLPASSTSADRVHFAILLVAEGSVDRFEAVLRLAETDWRDVLVSAGLEHDDWREVLRELGIAPGG